MTKNNHLYMWLYMFSYKYFHSIHNNQIHNSLCISPCMYCHKILDMLHRNVQSKYLYKCYYKCLCTHWYTPHILH